jgi:glycosyltransferase involved in cell wall biosynthesis
MMRMKILHVVPSFGLGGMEKVISIIVNHTLSDYAHMILSLDGNERAFQWIHSNNVHNIQFHKDKNLLKYLKDLYGSIINTSPDLLMTYNWGATDAIWLGRLAGIKHIIHHEHGFSIEEARVTAWKRDLCRLVVYRMASKLVTVSSRLKDSFQRKFWLQNTHIHMIPNGIDSEYFSPDTRVRQDLRQELKFDENDFVIVFSGRLDPVKNFSLLLEVFKDVHDTDQAIKLLIVGDGPERQIIEQLSLQYNVHTDVRMVGQKIEVLPYLRAGDAFLLTSITEQMPLTILEAMSVGLPVVASDVGEIHNVIDDGEDGFLRNIHDGPEGFARALLSLKDPVIRQAMSQAARAKIVSSFQETMMVRRYQELIDDLLRPSPAGRTI